MDNQLRELLTNYGEIAGIWFDGMWDKPDADWRLAQDLWIDSQLAAGRAGRQQSSSEAVRWRRFPDVREGLPGKNTTGFSGKSEIGGLPLETCDTMNDAWGYNSSDKKFKTTPQLIQYLVKAAGNNANFLLNVGPMPNGKIQPEFVHTLHEMGEWLRKNGESIYDTRGGPITPRPWGVTTQKSERSTCMFWIGAMRCWRCRTRRSLPPRATVLRRLATA